MIVRTFRIDGNQRYSWIKNQRSLFVSRTRPCSLRLKTINWCPSTAFSASSRNFDLNARPERNRAARSFRQLRRFHHGFNQIRFSVHTGLFVWRVGLARRTVRQRMAHNRPSSLALLKASSMAAKASACRVGLVSYGPTFSCSKTDLVDSFTVGSACRLLTASIAVSI
jgi:hypothetical protein